jgi:hypothetical protein
MNLHSIGIDLGSKGMVGCSKLLTFRPLKMGDRSHRTGWEKLLRHRNENRSL